MGRLHRKWEAAKEYYALGGPREVGKRTLQMVAERVNDRFLSTNVYEREWDVLVVLDACRADLMAEVVGQDWQTGQFDTIYSVATKTNEWLSKTFTANYAEEMAGTIYVSGNPNSHLVDDSAFGMVDHVWKYVWDDDVGTMPPRAVTDRGIQLHREHDPERLILHYMQPHYPFIPAPELDDGIVIDRFRSGETPDYVESVWDHLRRGELDTDDVWEAYRENLRVVLDELDLLTENVDAEAMVVTSDHGNAFGEFGLYGHPRRMPIPALTRVPWLRTEGTDRGEYVPSTEREPRNDGLDVTDKLTDLGYLS